ncbi:MAG: hypothetical protein A2293_02930 [Elusimicrobia bacterium RIFOXYB2_FULL_49_7]|nr:MAG: hypothetical protein A2293_02930 [Elusimicrobia bacterium RIFOXYB2_FULL_49_7]
MSKRILIVLPRQGGSRSLGENIHFAFTRMGHETTLFDFGRYRDGLGRLLKTEDDNLITDLANQALVVKSLEVKADLVLVMALSPVHPFTVQMLKNAHIRTAHYFCEDLRSADHWKPIIQAYDDFFIIQKDPWLSDLKQNHYARTFYLPHGAPLENLNDPPLKKEFNAIFVGAPYQNRVLFFERLAALNVDFRIWGWGWDRFPLSPALKSRLMDGTRWLSHAEIISLYSRAKMVINLHSTLTGKEVDENGDFLNPRAFTVPVCRALQIVDRRKSLADFFVEGKDVVCFASLEELAGKIRYYTAHWNEAEAIIEAAYQRTLSGHLLSDRLNTLLSVTLPKQTPLPHQGIPELAEQARARLKQGNPLSDDDFLHLLAENILIKKSTEETADG